MKRFRSIAKWVGRWAVRGLLVGVVLGLLAVVVINWRGSAAREAALQAMADAGIALPSRGSNDRDGETYNGAVLVRAAMEASAFPHDWGEDAPVFSTDDAMQTAFGEQIDPMIADRVVRFRDRLGLVLDLIERAASAERYDYDPWPHLRGEELSSLWQMRQIARTLQSVALADEVQGDFDAAMERYRQLLTINASRAEIPSLTWQYVRLSIDALVQQAMEETLSRGEASASAVNALREAVLAAESRSGPLAVVTAKAIEQAFQLEGIQSAAARRHSEVVGWLKIASETNPDYWPGDLPGPVERAWLGLTDRLELMSAWVCPGWLKLKWADALRETLAWRDVLALAPAEGAKRIVAAATADDDLALALRSALMQQAWLRVAATALAVEQYRLEHGEWPGSPTDLGEAWMTDPFDGEPLRYRRTDAGVVVYSIGKDLEDDGGDPDFREGDIPFRLLDPAHRPAAGGS